MKSHSGSRLILHRDHGLDTCDIPAYLFDATRIVKLVGCILESQVEEFLLCRRKLFPQFDCCLSLQTINVILTLHCYHRLLQIPVQ